MATGNATSNLIPHVTAEQLRQALPFPALIHALRHAFAGQIHAPLRQAHGIDGTSTTLLFMPVWQPAGAFGVKLVTVTPDNPERNLPTVHALFVLFDGTTGAPLAILDGETLTARRTAAVSALASSFLSRTDSQTLLVIGTGALAPVMAAAHCTVRPIRRILVWGRSPGKAARTLVAIREQGVADDIALDVADDLQAALGSADIVSCATTSTHPIVPGQWVRPGTHVDLVGAFKPTMREADDDLMADASIFVDTCAGALAEAGDLIQPLACGRLRRENIVAELAGLCTGAHSGRTDGASVTVFKSVGSGIADLCAAQLAWNGLPKGASV